MPNPELETLLEILIRECNLVGHPLDEAQQQVLLQTLSKWFVNTAPSQVNPLDQLTPDQQQALIRFIQTQQNQGKDWKSVLLNDWLQNRDSGSVQFVRDIYGLPWLESITPAHLEAYLDEDHLRLNVGDRIEVCNALWEWVQDDGPCCREWFPCTVIGIKEATNPKESRGLVRFDNGSEFEIQGLYDWNRPNWRTLQTNNGK